MPRFFLNSCAAGTRIDDPEGVDLADLAAARGGALAAMRELWAVAIAEGRDLGDAWIEIADAAGQPLATLAFDEALPAAMRARLSVR